MTQLHVCDFEKAITRIHVKITLHHCDSLIPFYSLFNISVFSTLTSHNTLLSALHFNSCKHY